MEPIFIVSYPRSGQHYAQRLVERVAGPESYCELYNCWDEACPGRTYPASMKSPCRAGRRFQKSHDFDLSLPVHDAFKYVALWRDPIYAIVSYYELLTAQGDVFLSNVGYVPDSRETWEVFAAENAVFWRRFVLKWTAAASYASVFAARYEDIVQDINAVRAFCEFCFGSVDEALMREAVARERQDFESRRAKTRELGAFRYPVHETAPKILDMIGPEALAAAGYRTAADSAPMQPEPQVSSGDP